MSFNDFFLKYNLKKKATSNMKIQQVLSSFSLSDVEVSLRDGLCSSKISIVNLHPPKGTHCVCYINENYYESYGCTPPQILSKFIMKWNGYCLYSEYQIQKLIVIAQVIVYIYFT